MLRKILLIFVFIFTPFILLPGIYIGNLNTDASDANSVNNPYGTYGSKFSALSINNEFGRYGSKFSNYSATNQFATCSPKLYTQNGVYLGKLSANNFELDSISNPYGVYGNKYSPCSVWSLYNSTVISIYGE